MLIRDEYISLDALVPDPANYNVHSRAAVAELVDKIMSVGFTTPCLVDDASGIIAAGHKRRLALLEIREKGYRLPAGIQPGWMVPCRVGSWDHVQRLKVLVGDNPKAGSLEYDPERLSALLCELQSGDTLDGTGYDEAALDKLIGQVAGKSLRSAKGRVVGGALIIEGEPTGRSTTGKKRKRRGASPETSAIADTPPVCCPQCGHSFVPGSVAAAELSDSLLESLAPDEE